MTVGSPLSVVPLLSNPKHVLNLLFVPKTGQLTSTVVATSVVIAEMGFADRTIVEIVAGCVATCLRNATKRTLFGGSLS